MSDTEAEPVEEVEEEVEEEDPIGADAEEINPYDVSLENCDITFITRVSEVSTLGEAAEVTALNIIRYGLDSYYLLYTDTDTGQQYISEGGKFYTTDSGTMDGDLIYDDDANE